MTNQTYGYFGLVSVLPSATSGNNSSNVHLLDATGEKSAQIFQAPKTGEIDRVCFCTSTVTTGCTVDVRLETLGADGNPSGTLADTNTNASQVIANGDDEVWFEVTLTASATVTQGDFLAIVVVWGTGGNLNIKLGHNAYHYAKFPYTSLYTSSWAKGMTSPNIAIRYDDASYPNLLGVISNETETTQGWTSGSTPDEIGSKFQVPWPATVIGFQGMFDINNGATTPCEFVLYDASDVVVLTISVDEEYANNAGTNGRSFYLFASSATLTKNVNYRLVMKPGTTGVQVFKWASNDANAHAAWAGGDKIHYTTRTNAGAWTDDTASLAAIWPIFNGFDDAASVGSASGVRNPLRGPIG